MRLFVAVNMPPETREGVHDATAPLHELLPTIRWTTAPNLHLTVKFLGDVAEERVGDVQAVVRSVAARHHAFELSLGGIGGFPRLHRPRVLWMGVEPEPRFELLHDDVERSFAAIGFEIEGRPFRPHLTLARVRTQLSEDHAQALRRTAPRITYRTEIPVNSLDLMQSTLGHGGSRYACLVAAPLDGALGAEAR